MVLEKGIDAFALEEVAVEDVVFDVVAVVHHKGDIDHQSGAVALTVATGVRLVGRETVIHPEFGLGESVGDEAAAGRVFVMRSSLLTGSSEIVPGLLSDLLRRQRTFLMQASPGNRKLILMYAVKKHSSAQLSIATRPCGVTEL